MEHRHLAAFHKIVSVLSSFTLLFQSILPAASIPLLFANQVSAEEATQSASEPTFAPTPTEEPTPTAEITPTPTEELSPTPTVEVTPEITPEPTVTIAPTEEATPTAKPNQEDVPAPTSSEPPHETSPPDQQNNAPQEAPTPTDTPTPTITPKQSVQGHLEAVVLNNVDAETLDLDAGNTITSATLTTDKADYAPTDTALISGTGFTPNTTYSLTVSSDDPPATSTTVQVTADENGNFIYAYQLDGTYRPNYKVEIKEGNHVIATTTFTDGASIDLEQCHNKDGVIVNCTDLDGPTNYWGGGDAQSNNSELKEGDNQNFRAIMSDVPVGTYTLVIELDLTKGGKVAYDRFSSSGLIKTVLNSTGSLKSPTDGAPESLGIFPCVKNGLDDYCSPATIAYTSIIPTITGITAGTLATDVINAQSAANPQQMTVYGSNVAITFPASPYAFSGNITGDSSLRLTINVVKTGSTGDVVLAWGGHVSKPSDYITSGKQTASSINGSPYHMRLISFSALNGNPGHQDMQVAASAVLLKPQITVQKNVDTDGNGTSDRTATTDEWSFAIDNGNPIGTDSNGQVIFSDLSDGQHTITESGPTNYTFLSGSGTTNCIFNGSTATATVAAGNPPTNATCTFLNGIQLGSISGQKYSDLNGNRTKEQGESGLSGWTIYLDTNDDGIKDITETSTVTDGSGNYSFTGLPNGTYHVREVQQTGWQQTAPQGGKYDITLSGNNSTGNDFGNRQLATMIVKKVMVGGEDTFTFTGSPSGTISTNNGTITVNSVVPNQYVSTESEKTGWTLDSIVCDDRNSTGDTQARTATFNVEAGETVTCTFTNTKDATLTLVKTVTIDNGGGAAATAWTLGAAGPTNISGVTGSPAVTSATVNSGTYTLSESGGPSGYAEGTWSCNGGTQSGDQITLAAGESSTCTITNDDISPTLKLIKSVTKNNGGTAVPHDWTLSALTANGQEVFSDFGDSATFYPVNANRPYTLIESTVPGYSDVGWSCTDGTLNGNIVTLGLAQQVTCTITNDDQPGQIKIIKNAVGGNGTFGFTITGPTPSTPNITTTNNTGDTGFITVNAGTYSISETGQTGWDLTGSFCDSGTPAQFIVPNSGTVTCTFTNTKRVSISGYKQEVNADSSLVGVLPNWVIQLYSGQTLIAQTTTDVLGAYSFTNVLAGTYSLVEILQTGWTQIFEPSVLILAPGDAATDQNFGNFQYVTISGQKYNDLNGDGDKDAGEPGLADWTINSSSVSGTLSTITDVNGNYSFSDLGPGTYTLTETLQNGWAQTSTNPAPITPLSGQDTSDIDFGNFNFGQISGTKYEDVNGSGEDDPGEAVLSGWTIYIDTNGDGDLDLGEPSTTTDANGDYVFSNLGPGTYTIREVQQAGWTQTDPTSLDSSIGGQNDGSYVVTMTSNGNKTQRNFGNRQLLGDIIVHKELDTDGDGVFDDGGDIEANTLGFLWGFDTDPTLTKQMGTSATDIPTTDYNITENDGDVAGYHFTGWYDSNNGSSCEEPDGEELPAAVTVNDGQTTQITLCNARDTADITVIKNIDGNNDGDLDDIVDQTNVSGWTWDITGGAQNIPMGDTRRTLVTNTYTITEDGKPGDYALVSWSCDNNTNGTTNSISLTLAKDDPVTCQFINTPVSDVHGYKWNDINGNGQRDEEDLLGGWTIFLDKNGNGLLNDGEQYTQTEINSQNVDFGWYWFYDLLPGDYRICEVLQPGWQQTYPTSPVCHNITLPEQGEQTQNAVLAVEHNFGNQQVNPILTLAKSNNAVGDKTPGSDVVFTLTVTATQSGVSNVIVKDLPSAGFTYRAGSWSAKINGVPFTITEPVYASPGTWNIGNMNAGDVVELQYIADIATSQQSGTYRDLAWATGTSVLASEVLANNDTGVFVGTDVAVNSGDNPNTSVNIIREEKKEATGQVLGAATELPATGGNTFWLILASVLFVFGGGSIVAGITLERSAKGRSSAGRKRRLHA